MEKLQTRIICKCTIVAFIMAAIAAVLGIIMPFSHTDSQFISTSIGKLESNAIKEGRTGSFFNGELYITVNEVHHYPPPQTITATIGTPDYANLIIGNVEIGYAISYDSIDKFNVRVARIRSELLGYSVKFLVTRLGDESQGD